MASRPRVSMALLSWGCVCAALLVLLAAEIFWAASGPDLDRSVTPARVADAALLPPLRAAPLDGEPELVSRPLFVPSRRPSPPAMPATEATSMKRGQFVLQGTISTPGLSFAMLRETASGKIHRVPLGGTVSNLTLKDVGTTSVTLALGDETEVVTLVVSKAVASPGTSPAGGPFAAQAGSKAATPAAPPPSQPAPMPSAVPGAPPPTIMRNAASTTGAPPSANPAQPSSAQGAAEGALTFQEITRRRARALGLEK